MKISYGYKFLNFLPLYINCGQQVQFQKIAILGKIKKEEIFSFFLIDAHRCAQGVRGESVVRFRKFGYKNAIKYKEGTPRFSGSTKCPLEKNLDKTRRTPLLDFQLLCIDGDAFEKIFSTLNWMVASYIILRSIYFLQSRCSLM